jgi:hypothetical protein
VEGTLQRVYGLLVAGGSYFKNKKKSRLLFI